MLGTHRLHVLQQVARSGSLAGAARALSYTQPAVAHHVSELEREVRTPLVVRHGRGVRLTEAGIALAAHADAILSRLAAAEDEVAAIAGLQAGRVRVAAYPTAAATLVPGALVALQAQHPGIVASLDELEPPEALAALRAGDVDLAVTFEYPDAPADGADRDLVATPLGDDAIDIVAPAGHSPAGHSPAGHPGAGDLTPGASPAGSPAAGRSVAGHLTAGASPDGSPGAGGAATGGSPAGSAVVGSPVTGRSPAGRPVASGSPVGHPMAGDLAPGGLTPGASPAERPPAGAYRLADLAGDTWVAGCDRCRAHLVRSCRRAGFEPRIAFTTDDFVTQQALVAAGLAVAAMPRSTLAAHAHPGLQAGPCPELGHRRIEVVVARDPVPPAVAALRDQLVAHGA